MGLGGIRGVVVAIPQDGPQRGRLRGMCRECGHEDHQESTRLPFEFERTFRTPFGEECFGYLEQRADVSACTLRRRVASIEQIAQQKPGKEWAVTQVVRCARDRFEQSLAVASRRFRQRRFETLLQACEDALEDALVEDLLGGEMIEQRRTSNTAMSSSRVASKPCAANSTSAASSSRGTMSGVGRCMPNASYSSRGLWTSRGQRPSRRT
jgi:hypothetical protein